MAKGKNIAAAAITAALTLGLGTMTASTTAIAEEDDMQKCYGVTKKGMNDCGNAMHSCQGQSTTDGDASEWVYLPNGACDKIVDGSTESK